GLSLSWSIRSPTRWSSSPSWKTQCEAPMQVKLDPRADALYIRLNLEKPQKYTRRLDWRRLIDYAEDDTPLAVELRSVSKGVNVSGLPEPGLTESILADYKIKVLHA